MDFKHFLPLTCVLLAGCGGSSQPHSGAVLSLNPSSPPISSESPLPVETQNSAESLALSCVGTLYSVGGSDASSNNGKELNFTVPASGILKPQILAQNSTSTLVIDSDDHDIKISLLRKVDQMNLGSSVASRSSGTFHFSHHLANTFAWMICNRSFKQEPRHAIEKLISPALWACQGTLDASNHRDPAIQNQRVQRVQTLFSDQEKETLLLSNRTTQIFLVSQSGKISLVTRKKSNADQISYTLADNRADHVSSSLNQASLQSQVDCVRVTSPQN